jgi:hypothetical protein
MILYIIHIVEPNFHSVIILAAVCMGWIEWEEVDCGYLDKHDYRMNKVGRQYNIVIGHLGLNMVDPAFQLCSSGDLNSISEFPSFCNGVIRFLYLIERMLIRTKGLIYVYQLLSSLILASFVDSKAFFLIFWEEYAFNFLNNNTQHKKMAN